MDPRLAEVVAHTIVPVVVIDDAASAQFLGEALVAGGLPIAEITFRTPAAREAIAAMAKNPDLLVGAGTEGIGGRDLVHGVCLPAISRVAASSASKKR